MRWIVRTRPSKAGMGLSKVVSPVRMMRNVALATRDQHIDRELGSLSDRVTALSAVQAPVVQQPTQQVVRYEPQGQI